MTGLHVYRSNRLEVLVALLAEQLRRPAADPFAPLQVVVGSRGMERHLRHALAEHLGICAHVDFPFPTAALDALVREVLAASPDAAAAAAADGADAPPTADPADPWAPGALTWALLEVLGPVAAGEHGGPLRRYLADAAPGAVDARTWGLARRIADTFDRYVTFRPELAVAWSGGEVPPGVRADPPDGQRWQRALWRAARTHLGDRPHCRSVQPRAESPKSMNAVGRRPYRRRRPPPWRCW